MEYCAGLTERLKATVQRIEKLNAETIFVRLSCPEIEHYKAGQHIKVFLKENTVRSYSLASSPSIDQELQLHIRRGGAGSASHWFHDVLKTGDCLYIGLPHGTSHYQPEFLSQPLLMIGTGTGIAPLYAMAREALHHGHKGEVHFYHGVRHRHELYLVDQLKALSRLNRNFFYTPCISGGEPADDLTHGRALDIALRETHLDAQWRVYLSGNPNMVHDGWKQILATSVLQDSIFSDHIPSFVLTANALAA